MVRLVLAIWLLAAAGCTNHEMVLRREGQNAVMCHASGMGLLWVYLAERNYDQCVEQYLSQGYSP